MGFIFDLLFHLKAFGQIWSAGTEIKANVIVKIVSLLKIRYKANVFVVAQANQRRRT